MTTFNCSMNCNEVFDFTFVTDGTPSSASLNILTKIYTLYNV